jgi:hypothetical protein
MLHYDNDTNNNNNLDKKKTAIKSKMYGRFITTVALPTLLLLPTLISAAAAPTYPVQAMGGSNQTAVTPAPSGASVGPAANGTNATTTSGMQSACLPQNATTTTTGSPPPVNATSGAGANTTTINNATSTNATSITVAPSGASIGTNRTTTSNATAGNTTGNTSVTVAPSGASIC